ncbi:MAG TPA: hypothetical protein VHY48_07085, partial [Acidobacteriaceae bacterium]|nr:hypothetical protein [Acidobacteriaceae bacterium]
MKQRRLLFAALVCTLLFTLAAVAQESGYWRASSTSAKSITGDVSFSSLKVSFNYSAFTIAQIRTLQPAEAAALFSADNTAPGAGNLYRVDIPASKHFLHHNSLCGSEDTAWVITWVQGHTLQLALFSGAALPP